MISEKQLMANRRNALRSTGPRTDEGKARSRLNATRHGLAGAGTGLLEEDSDQRKERLARWTAELGPRNEVEAYLIESAVVASVRVDRCVRTEFALAQERRRETILSWEQLEDQKLQALLPSVCTSSNEALDELLSFSTGCEWLMSQWEFFREGLRTLGYFDANNLTGAKTIVQSGQADNLDALNAVATQNEEGANEAREQLAQIIETELDRLRLLRDELWKNEEAPLVQQVLDETAFDAGPQAVLMRRYETACRNDLHRALRDLARIRKDNILASQETPVVPTAVRPREEEAPSPEALAATAESELRNEAIPAARTSETDTCDRNARPSTRPPVRMGRAARRKEEARRRRQAAEAARAGRKACVPALA